MARAPAGVRSITRPRTNGPLSVIVTTTLRPLVRLVTRTRLPKGSVLCAAVSAPSWSARPLDVRVPCSRVEYDEAIPLSAQAEPVVAMSAATRNIDAFMLWITPLRDAPPDNWLPHRHGAPGIGKPSTGVQDWLDLEGSSMDQTELSLQRCRKPRCYQLESDAREEFAQNYNIDFGCQCFRSETRA